MRESDAYQMMRPSNLIVGDGAGLNNDKELELERVRGQMREFYLALSMANKELIRLY